MSSISDALKRAQQERERHAPRESPSGKGVEPGTLASVVLRKNPPEKPDPASPAVSGAMKSTGAGETAAAAPTPVSAAMQHVPPLQTPAAKAHQQATETIVEDYTSKYRLNLPHSLVVYHERAGRIAEQYRRIRETLMFANSKREPQMLVITSSMEGEGKTTTVLNLGLSLVEVRSNRVLLIDGNLHGTRHPERPSLTALLKMQSEPGLAAMLSSAQEAMTFVRATPWQHLFLLPAGMPMEAAACIEMLKSPTLPQKLRQLRSNFDWVLIDCPAAANLPDAGIFGGVSDAIILAVALHHTPEERALRTVRRLKSMNLPVKSCILTRA